MTSPEEPSGTYYHYGTGDIDRSVLERPEETRERRIGQEPHRQEPVRASSLLDPLGRDDRVINAGPRPQRNEIQPNDRFGCAST